MSGFVIAMVGRFPNQKPALGTLSITSGRFMSLNALESIRYFSVRSALIVNERVMAAAEPDIS